MGRANIRSSMISLLLLFALVFAVFPAPRAYAAKTSGECGKDGDNLTWSYSGGVLTISGEGEMADYAEERDVPWYEIRMGIKQVELPEGLTSLGDRAFYDCSSLTSIALPEGLISIGGSTFYRCRSLTSVTLPDSLTSIGEGTFYDCRSLTSITLPDSLTSIGVYAFYMCDSLTLTVGHDTYAEQYCKDNGLNYQYPDNLDWLRG